MFFNKSWTIGKVIDEITNSTNIINKNHIPGEEVCHFVNINNLDI
jgi:hypothetical protein